MFSMILLLCLTCLFLPTLHCRGEVRRGEMSDKEIAAIEDMLNTVTDDDDVMNNLVVPPPPMTDMDHRDPRILCTLGNNTYCPGELLFSLGNTHRVGKVCSRMGSFVTKRVSPEYQEPRRCNYLNVEYCNGEIVRGFHGWHRVQYCRNGVVQLTPMDKRGFHSAMKMFLQEVK